MYTRNIVKSSISLFKCLVLGFIFFVGQGYVSAATLQLETSLTALSVGDTATISVFVDTEGLYINSSESEIKFSNEFIEVVSINKNNSIFSLWVEDPSFSNVAGIVAFNAGLPTPGFFGTRGQVVSFVVRAKKVGLANLYFSGASVRANDGFGTNVLNSSPSISIVVAENIPNLSIDVFSLTHSNQAEWYSNSNPEFYWSIPDGVDAIQTGISKDISDSPHVLYKPVISKKNVTDLDDGVWYFKIRPRKSLSWGSISTYIVRIDNTPPISKKVEFSYNGVTKILTIFADVQDETSGVEWYEIFVDDVLVKKVSSKDFVDGSYELAFKASGDNRIKLVAIDRAGNKIDISGSFNSTALPIPELELIPSVISAEEQVLVRGVTQYPDTKVVLYIKRLGDDAISFSTKSNSDKNFFVLTPRLKPGEYDFWAEVVFEGKSISSEYLHTKVTSKLLITVGSVTITAFSLVFPALAILLLLFMFVYYLWHHFDRFKHRQKMKTALVKGDNFEVLRVLKKRLEKHLELLQETRHHRILTREEKEIKDAIEKDLDDVDKILAKYS